MRTKLNKRFCHLHLHNEYSQLDGLGTAKQYVSMAKKMGFRYIGLTNHGNIDGLINWQKECEKQKIYPILGVELYVVEDAIIKEKGDKRKHITLFVKNRKGFKNLCKLMTYANVEGFYYRPRIDYEVLYKHLEGLLLLTGCTDSFLRIDKDRKILNEIYDIIGDDLYLEVMPHRIKKQKILNEIVVGLHEVLDIPMVATNDVHYIRKEDWKAHEVLLAIQSKSLWTDKDRFRFSIKGLYLKSYKEMVMAFRDQGILDDEQIKESLRNTVKVARKCRDFRIKKMKMKLPMPYIKRVNENEYFWDLCDKGLANLKLKGKKYVFYLERAKEECQLIFAKNFTRYFLIVQDLVDWCESNDIMVGPGRGSVGGSLVAYLLGITKVDPIKHDLLFSRFISEDRIDFPDIDLDFEDKEREKVQAYLEWKYGENYVAGVTAFQRMKGRNAVRDVGRVFAIDYRDVDEFAKAIDPIAGADDTGLIMEAVEETDEGRRFKKQYPKIVRYASKLEGQIRSYSKHAAAVIVSDINLTKGTRGHLAIRNKNKVICWEKNDAEYMGLVKLDILGLNNLTILHECQRVVKENHGVEIDFESISLNDKKLYKEIAEGNTSGMFQINTPALRRICKELKVDSFSLLSDVIALVRPGPADSGMLDDFIRRRQGGRWTKKHELYEKILKDTYGVIVYQEQVMEIINKVAGLPHSTADKVRKVIGKKRSAKEFKHYKVAFIDGCRAKGTLNRKEANLFWEGLEKHARYSFNKSHSVAYAMIAIWTAYCKVYYPLEYICACLSFMPDDKKEQKQELLSEAQLLGLNVIVPKVGISRARRWITKDDQLYLPFIEAKGIGAKWAVKIANLKTGGRKGFFKSKGKKNVGHKTIDKILEDIDAFNPANKIPEGAHKYFSYILETTRTKQILLKEKRYQNKKLLRCRECSLRSEATRPVLPSKGKTNVMIIGQDPGRREDEEGIGFIGPAGNLLWEIMGEHNYTRKNFHVTNVVKCWPSKSKKSKPEHIRACRHWLYEEIEKLECSLALCLGGHPYKLFTGNNTGILKANANTQWLPEFQMYVVWCVHPAWVLRDREDRMSYIEEGVKVFMHMYETMFDDIPF